MGASFATVSKQLKSVMHSMRFAMVISCGEQCDWFKCANHWRMKWKCDK
jgi:hypothetical protein